MLTPPILHLLIYFTIFIYYIYILYSKESEPDEFLPGVCLQLPPGGVHLGHHGGIVGRPVEHADDPTLAPRAAPLVGKGEL